MNDTKCKNCGGNVDYDEITGIGTCQYCGTKHAAPQEEATEIQQQKTRKNFNIKNTRKSVTIRIIVIIIVVVAYIIYMVNLFH